MSPYTLRDPGGRTSGPWQDADLKAMARDGRLGPGFEVADEDGVFKPVRLKGLVTPPPWFRLELAIQPTWAHVARIRESLVHHLSTVFRDADYCHALTTMVAELLENAIKYGDWQRFATALVKLKISSDAKAGSMVEVAGPCSVDSVEAQEVLRAIADLGRQPALVLYQRRLLQIAEGGAGDEDRVLALLRVAYESGCSMRATIDADNALRITAMLPPPA